MIWGQGAPAGEAAVGTPTKRVTTSQEYGFEEGVRPETGSFFPGSVEAGGPDHHQRSA